MAVRCRDGLEVDGNHFRSVHQCLTVLRVFRTLAKQHFFVWLGTFDTHSGKFDRQLETFLRCFGNQARQPALRRLVLSLK